MVSNILQDEYRLVLLHPESRAVLVETDRSEFRLPRVVIPCGIRTAREIQQSIKGRWGGNAFVLDFVPGAKASHTFAIAEMVSSCPLRGLSKACIDDIPDEELDCAGRGLAESILSSGPHSGRPFLRLGWIKEAVQWLSTEVDGRLLQNADIRQYNAGGTFALVRFETYEGQSYWLKATGSPNEHEPRLTKALAGWLEDYLPRILAHRSDWNAWVTEDCGKPLSDVTTYAAYRKTVSSLGNPQIASATRVGDLLDAGCADLRVRTLAAHTPALIAYLEGAMDRQTSTKAMPLSSNRLRELGQMIEGACAEVDSLKIPDTLLHNSR